MITITTIFLFTGIPNRGRDLQPKTIHLGGAVRQYMSPQAFRAAMRDQQIAPMASIITSRTIRSRVGLKRALDKRLAEKGIAENIASAFAIAVGEIISGVDEDGNFSAPVVLGEPEIDAIADIAASLVDEHGAEVANENTPEKRAEKISKKLNSELKKALHNAATSGTEAVIFGRMVTNPSLPRVDGALATSAAIGVNGLQVAYDFFVAQDQLTGSTEGTAHMGTQPISTGVFVQENVIDPTRLRNQLPDEDHAAIIAWIIRASALAPTKLARAGSTPPAGASEVFVTVDPMPRSAMEAFMRPADLSPNEAAARALEAMANVDKLYGAPGYRASLSGAGGLDGLVAAVAQNL